MKVKDLIEKLNGLDPELDILVIREDKNIVPKGHSIRVLEMIEIDKTKAVPSRGGDGIVSVRFYETEQSLPYAYLKVMSDI